MINLKISKLIKPENIKGELITHRKLSHLNGIQTGDTTGEILIAIGTAMRDGESRINASTAKRLGFKLDLLGDHINNLGLKHLKIARLNGNTLVITYDIYISEDELFRAIS